MEAEEQGEGRKGGSRGVWLVLQCRGDRGGIWRDLLQGQRLFGIGRNERHRHAALKHCSSFTGWEAQLHCQRLPEFAGPLQRGSKNLKCCGFG